MKRMVCIAVVGASLIAAALPALAADDGQTFAARGGTESCGTWTQGRKNKDLPMLMREGWLFGYITAVNMWYLPTDRGVASRDLLEGADNEGILAWIDNYCAARPLDTLSLAAEAMVRELAPKWFAAHPPHR